MMRDGCEDLDLATEISLSVEAPKPNYPTHDLFNLSILALAGLRLVTCGKRRALRVTALRDQCRLFDRPVTLSFLKLHPFCHADRPIVALARSFRSILLAPVRSSSIAPPSLLCRSLLPLLAPSSMSPATLSYRRLATAASVIMLLPNQLAVASCFSSNRSALLTIS